MNIHSMSHRNFRQIRAIKNYAHSLHMSDLDVVGMLWVINGLAQQWAEGER